MERQNYIESVITTQHIQISESLPHQEAISIVCIFSQMFPMASLLFMSILGARQARSCCMSTWQASCLVGQFLQPPAYDHIQSESSLATSVCLTGEQTWIFIMFSMCDENTTVTKRVNHSHFDWPSGGSCHSQALSQLGTTVAELLAKTIYIFQLTANSLECTHSSVQFPRNAFVSTGPCYKWSLAPLDHCQS